MDSRIRINEASRFEGQEVTLQGWVYQKRSSGKVKFLVLRDGSGLMQGILHPSATEVDSMEAFESLTQESSLRVRGVLKKEPRSPGGFEMSVIALEVLHVAQNYPISPKEHGVEFLMENRHLWLRSQKQWATLKIRGAIIQSIQNFLNGAGYLRFDAPILTPSSCEGTSELFSTDYFETQAYLTQSGQLYGEVGAMAFGRIYTFGPTFRAEKSKTRKHLTEFWMLEPEIAFGNLEDAMLLSEQLIKAVIQDIGQTCVAELAILERDFSTLLSFTKPFPRITYEEALSILKTLGFDLAFGDDFGAPHEAALGEHFKAPVFIHHMPASMKAFYFKQVDTPFGESVTMKNGKYAACADLIAPEGYGELVGGGCREEDAATLEKRIVEHKLPLKDYQWYLDLRRFGTVPHSGFGLGLERFVAWIAGSEHIRESVPFPRMIHHLSP